MPPAAPRMTRQRHEGGGGRRLFFALWPGAAVGKRLCALQRRLPSRRPARLAAAADLHLTLLFLGRIPPEAESCVCAGAGAAAPVVAPFALTLDRLGYWPRPRILWLAPSSPPAPLLELAERLRCAAADCGLATETRPYAPHVTLCRWGASPRNPPEVVPIRWRARSFVLAASEPQGGARYRILRSWKLG